MPRDVSKRDRLTRYLFFELLEIRECLSASGQVSSEPLFSGFLPDVPFQVVPPTESVSTIDTPEGDSSSGEVLTGRLPPVDLRTDSSNLTDTDLGNASSVQAITTRYAVQQSPSVAVDLLDPEHIVLAYTDYLFPENTNAGIGVAVSMDGGTTWQSNFISLPQGFAFSAFDPIVKFDRDGHVFVSFWSYEGDAPFIANVGVFVARSDDGGLTWRDPVAVSSNVFDGNHPVPVDEFSDLAVDTVPTLPDGRANPNLGNLYATWTRFYPRGQFPGEPTATGGSDVMIAVSRDRGLTWQLQTETGQNPAIPQSVLQTAKNTGIRQDELNGFVQRSRVAVGATGDVSVADFVGGWFYVNHSDDAAAHFSVPTRTDPLKLPFGPGPILLTEQLTNNSSIIPNPIRAIASDPVRPGRIYVAEPLAVYDPLGVRLDAADITFAYSENGGATWSTQIVPGGFNAITVNDDNGGQPASGLANDVRADQFMVRMAVNAKGDIGLVWYDTRRDPANHKLDVYGAISTDGGKTFGPNFRVTDQSFDADAAVDANLGIPNLGNALGLAMSNDDIYVAWTDTRNGNQDVYFRRLSLPTLSEKPNDRFEPNNFIAQATDLGQVLSMRLPKLALDASDVDYFQVQSPGTGTLKVTVTPSGNSEALHVQILDATGQVVSGESRLIRDINGIPIARQVIAPSVTGQVFAIRVTSDNVSTSYSLEVNTLTEDLGPLVLHSTTGEMTTSDQLYYRFESTANGTISVKLNPLEGANGSTRLAFVDSRANLVSSEVFGVNPELRAQVRPGQELFLQISSVGGASSGGFPLGFQLRIENIDQFTSLGESVLQFPTGTGPSQMAVGDFNNDLILDVAVTNTGINTVSVSLGNGDGTFASPRSYAVGAFQVPNPVGDDAHLNTYRRDILTADFNNDGVLDLVVTNYDSSDVSVLLGNGDGTFQPQRRFDATRFPISVDAGDVNGDGVLDLVVLDSDGVTDEPNLLSVLIGRGDGTFKPQIKQALDDILFLAVAALGDLDNDGNLDLVVGGGIHDGILVFRGDGHGSFDLFGNFPGSRQAASLAIVDLNSDGNLDVVATSLSEYNSVTVYTGSGNLTLQVSQFIENVGQGPVSVKVADFGSELTQTDDPNHPYALGPPDGRLDLIVANSGAIPGPYPRIGPDGIVLLPGLPTDNGGPALFGSPIQLAIADQPLDLQIGYFDRDANPSEKATLDIAVVDRNGFFVIFGDTPNIRPNQTQATARELGTVVHTVQPTLTLLPGHEDSWFRLQVAGEAISAAGDQVLDFSAGFDHLSGVGLGMEVVDQQGNRRGAGDRFRIVASPGETLFVHFFAIRDSDGVAASGTYTLIINTLPQLVAVEATSLLPGQGTAPGGPISSLVLVLQGDRLDPVTVQNSRNYRVTWLGPDEILGTPDDRIVPVGEGIGASRAVLYSPSGNRDVASGLTYPTAIRKTITLLFGEALPEGSYQIEISPDVQTASFNSNERSLLTQRDGFDGHGIVSRTPSGVSAGVVRVIDRLVSAPGELGDLSVFKEGTRFLTQLYTDLGSLLDSILTTGGDNEAIDTAQILAQIIALLDPALGPIGQRTVSLLVVFLDPPPFRVTDPTDKSAAYNIQDARFDNALANVSVLVGGNVDLVTIPQPAGLHVLTLKDVPPFARGAWVYLGVDGNVSKILTQAIRDGQTSFTIGVPNPIPARPFNALVPGLPYAPPLLGVALRTATAELALRLPTGVSAMERIVSMSRVPVQPTATGERLDDQPSTNVQFQAQWDRILDLWLNGTRRLREGLMRTARGWLQLLSPSTLTRLIPWSLLHATVITLHANDPGSGDEPRSAVRSGSDVVSKSRPDSTSSRPRSHINRTVGWRPAEHPTLRPHTFDSVVFASRNSDEPIRRNPETTRANASVPKNAGPHADRTQSASQDRCVGHRATDDARSSSRDEPVRRSE